MGKRLLSGCLAGAAAVLACASSAAAEGVTAVPKLDLARMMGTYYEIARLPNKTEKHCVSDVTVLYALANRKRGFQIGTFCQLKDGTPDEYDNTGKQDKAGTGKLKLSHLALFSTPYWVLNAAPNFDWMLIGSPNHKSLWIFSRTATLAPETLNTLKAKATGEGYNLDKLITVTQHH